MPLTSKLIHTPGDGLHFLELPQAYGVTKLLTPEAKDLPCRAFRGSGGLSLGPVLLYADIFIRCKTGLTSIAEAFAQAYPDMEPPTPLSRRSLIQRYILHIKPLDPTAKDYAIPLWRDLTCHGLNRLAEVILLDAQEASYRKATGRPPPDRAKNMIRDLVRSLRPRSSALDISSLSRLVEEK